jgi:hypothetical protein
MPIPDMNSTVAQAVSSYIERVNNFKNSSWQIRKILNTSSAHI